MASGDARHRVSLGKRRSDVLKDHFGPQIVLYSPNYQPPSVRGPQSRGPAVSSPQTVVPFDEVGTPVTRRPPHRCRRAVFCVFLL